VKKLKDLFAGHVQKTIRLFIASFGNGKIITPSNVMPAANVTQPWIIWNF